MNNKPVLLVGAGPMAVEYAKVLMALNVEIIVVGRGQKSANEFRNKTGISAVTGGLEQWLLANQTMPDNAIVAVGEEAIGSVARSLVLKGCKYILVEKPGGKDVADILAVQEAAKKHNSSVYVAYNRRFYSAVLAAKKIIEADGGVVSFNFEFTEWSHIVKDLQKAEGVKKNWFLHNSTHVIDLAFYLGGWPQKFSCYTSGSADWHPPGMAFAGAGVTVRGALFSYQANWEAPGRWGVEILTRNNRLIFRPLEKLLVQKIGSVAIEEWPLDNKFDLDFKAGLYLQVRDFLSGNNDVLCGLDEQCNNLSVYKRIGNY